MSAEANLKAWVQLRQFPAYEHLVPTTGSLHVSAHFSLTTFQTGPRVFSVWVPTPSPRKALPLEPATLTQELTLLQLTAQQ